MRIRSCINRMGGQGAKVYSPMEAKVYGVEFALDLRKKHVWFKDQNKSHTSGDNS